MAQLSHLWFAGRRGVGTVIRVPVDPSVHPVPMLLGTKSLSRNVAPSRINVKPPGGVGRPSSYLSAGCPVGHPALASSVRQGLSTRPEHQSEQCVNADISFEEEEACLISRQELFVDNGVNCVVL